MMPKLSGFASEALPCERLVAPSGKFQLNCALFEGASSCARLNMSKAAKRNCSRVFSLSGNSLKSVMSHLLKPGVRKTGCSKLPNWPIEGSVTVPDEVGTERLTRWVCLARSVLARDPAIGDGKRSPTRVMGHSRKPPVIQNTLRHAVALKVLGSR